MTYLGPASIIEVAWSSNFDISDDLKISQTITHGLYHPIDHLAEQCVQLIVTILCGRQC